MQRSAPIVYRSSLIVYDRRRFHRRRFDVDEVTTDVDRRRSYSIVSRSLPAAKESLLFCHFGRRLSVFDRRRSYPSTSYRRKP
ncbi:MAG: hypothetical protein GY820_19750 [Gammaproteobacteria bacterium]|nr:hypothetical protein [Gammaproteobacteria bacterium]